MKIIKFFVIALFFSLIYDLIMIYLALFMKNISFHFRPSFEELLHEKLYILLGYYLDHY